MNVAFFHELHFGGARRVVVEYGKVFSKYHKIDLYYVDRQNEKDLEKIFKEHSFYPFLYKQYDGGNFPLKIYKDLVEPIRLYFLHKKISPCHVDHKDALNKERTCESVFKSSRNILGIKG